MSDEIDRAGRVALTDELYKLRCALAAREYGERSHTPDRVAERRRRVAVLEPLVGGELGRLLATEDDP